MRSLHILVIFLLCLFSVQATCTATHYDLQAEPIDVVIPCTKKDLDTLDLCINGIRRYGKNIRRIIVVSSERLTDQAEWFDENTYPFDKSAIALQIFQDPQLAQEYLQSKGNRIGWIYQQFLKLYAAYVIPNISSNVLILDADVVFLRPVTFMNEQGGALFNTATEYHPPYFAHMNQLLPGLKRLYPDTSGITHHMLFQKAVLDDLFLSIETYHQDLLWKAICNCIDKKELFGSCFSEYEIYFNFVFSRTDQMKIRPLKTLNTNQLNKLSYFQRSGYDYVAYHAYLRE